MKRILAGTFAMVMVIAFSGCVPTLIYEKQFPEFKAPADKALCVVIRPSMMYGQYSPLWLDKKYVGGTTGNTVASFEVAPGEHLVITKISLKTKVKLNFQAGKVYYLIQAAFPIPMVGVSTSLTPASCDEAVKKLDEEKGKCQFSRPNPQAQQPDLTDKEVQDEMQDWAKWAKDNPDKAKVESDYSGC